MRVSCSVMAHPDRADQVRELITALKRPVPIHWDEEGPPSGNGDRVWRQAKATWQLADPAADYHVLIQDDAVPCPDLLAGLERALEHVAPESLVSPYLGRGGIARQRWEAIGDRAEIIGASWVRSHSLMWGVCLAVPVHLLPEMIDWCDRRGRMPDDMRVAGWFKLTRRDVWYTWPSLVDHRLVPSLTKHQAADRVAYRHHAGSALDIDWSGPVMVDPMTDRRMGPRSGPTKRRPVR